MADLPKKYHKKGPTYYFVENNKWIPVGRTIRDVYLHAAKQEIPAEIKTMSQAINRYKAEILPSKADSTQKNYLFMLDKIEKVFGQMDVKMITHEDVCQFHDRLSRKAKTSANRHIEVISVLYKYLRRWAGTRENPAEGVIMNPEKPDKRYISDYEIQLAHSVASERDKLIIEMLYYSGQRLNDVLKMEWSHLNETGIDVDQGKTGAELTIKWSPALRSVIKKAKEYRGNVLSRWIFPSEDAQKLTVNGMQNNWRRLIKRAEKADKTGEFNRFNIRQIRAKARTDGKDKYLLGHADPDKMARVYYRKRRVVEPIA